MPQQRLQSRVAVVPQLKATGVEKTMRMIWSGRVAALDRHVRCTNVLYVVHELDLEAMMNHLDQKAEKKKEFNSELESLNEMLNMLGVELLTVKDGLQQIENGKHELATMNENMNDWIAKSELFVEAMREIASGIMESKPEVIIESCEFYGGPA